MTAKSKSQSANTVCKRNWNEETVVCHCESCFAVAANSKSWSANSMCTSANETVVFVYCESCFLLYL